MYRTKDSLMMCLFKNKTTEQERGVVIDRQLRLVCQVECSKVDRFVLEKSWENDVNKTIFEKVIEHEELKQKGEEHQGRYGIVGYVKTPPPGCGCENDKHKKQRSFLFDWPI